MSFLEIVGMSAVVILGMATVACTVWYGAVFHEFLVLLKCKSDRYGLMIDRHWEKIEELQKKVDQLYQTGETK